MRALIVAAGRGRRLDPYTRHTPKPLLYVAGKPILGHVLDALSGYGITDAVVVAGYLRDQLIGYLRARPGLSARIVVQEPLLGNGHAVYAARAHLDAPTLVLFGDTILRADLRPALQSGTAAVGVTEVPDARGFGIAEVDEQGRIRRLWEKPAVPRSRLAVAGAFFFPDPRPLRDALEHLVAEGRRRQGEFWFVDAVQLMIAGGEPVEIFAVDRFYDCGTVDRLLAANRDLLSEGEVEVEGLSTPRPGTMVVSPCAISPAAVVQDSQIGPFVTIAPGAQVARAQVRDAILLPGARVEGTAVEHAIVAASAPNDKADM